MAPVTSERLSRCSSRTLDALRTAIQALKVHTATTNASASAVMSGRYLRTGVRFVTGEG